MPHKQIDEEKKTMVVKHKKKKHQHLAQTAHFFQSYHSVRHFFKQYTHYSLPLKQPVREKETTRLLLVY